MSKLNISQLHALVRADKNKSQLLRLQKYSSSPQSRPLGPRGTQGGREGGRPIILIPHPTGPTRACGLPNTDPPPSCALSATYGVMRANDYSEHRLTRGVCRRRAEALSHRESIWCNRERRFWQPLFPYWMAIARACAFFAIADFKRQ